MHPGIATGVELSRARERDDLSVRERSHAVSNTKERVDVVCNEQDGDTARLR